MISGGKEPNAFIEILWARPLYLNVRPPLHHKEDDSLCTP